MSRWCVISITVLCFAGKAGAEEFKVVANNCQPAQKFQVVANHTRPLATVARAISGCGCSRGFNCSASFCKANGGSGCPSSCPINKSSDVVSSQAVSGPVMQGSNCANGQCQSSGSVGSWHPGKIVGKILGGR